MVGAVVVGVLLTLSCDLPFGISNVLRVVSDHMVILNFVFRSSTCLILYAVGPVESSTVTTCLS